MHLGPEVTHRSVPCEYSRRDHSGKLKARCRRQMTEEFLTGIIKSLVLCSEGMETVTRHPGAEVRGDTTWPGASVSVTDCIGRRAARVLPRSFRKSAGSLGYQSCRQQSLGSDTFCPVFKAAQGTAELLLGSLLSKCSHTPFLPARQAAEAGLWATEQSTARVWLAFNGFFHKVP